MNTIPVRLAFAWNFTLARQTVFLFGPTGFNGIYMGANMDEAHKALADWNAYRAEKGFPVLVLTQQASR